MGHSSQAPSAVPLLTAALALVGQLCQYPDFWSALDSSDITVVIRLVDHEDAGVREAALQMLRVVLSASLGTGTQSVC